MIRSIAFYLPQFHPIKENDEWYGKGFTEWTNVAKAKPLYRGHYQPHVPADLGFYDLRLKSVKIEQIELAKKYGITAFCYWYYWFGNGEQILEKPVWEMYNDKSIDFPYCIAWANHSWENKLWDSKGNNKLLKEQKYLGEEDYIKFFKNVLPLLKDERYLTINKKPVVVIYKPLASPEIKILIDTWRKLAIKENLEGIYFIGEDRSNRELNKIISYGFDATYNNNTTEIHHNLSTFNKLRLYFECKFLKKPMIFKYKDAIKYMVPKESKNENIFPCIAPNWDHSPRTGSKAIILDNCNPKYFYKVAKKSNFKCTSKI
ncbi:glycoside hydrolase family 99-like domain-containing protein [Candidatus Stoquefichus massiliensis]|uniref:glycosyltransferase WbsX family protein n=1 Tax=Candidatus Stoquefichus massiliensis TaxID=1470350 RepID=UPI0004BBBDCB|nr:glycoside hydrolase family 99-like domain-containing protein [Candidatus Stoquefichus massiliensis]